MLEFFIHTDSEAKVTSGRVLRKYFDQLKPNKNYKVIIKEAGRRTLPQNSFFHAILPDIQKGLYDMGFREVKTTEDAKIVVKNLFLKTVIKNEETGEEIPIVRETHKLSKMEMMEFLDEIIQWCSQYLNIVIAHPGQQSTMQYE